MVMHAMKGHFIHFPFTKKQPQIAPDPDSSLFECSRTALYITGESLWLADGPWAWAGLRHQLPPENLTRGPNMKLKRK